MKTVLACPECGSAAYTEANGCGPCQQRVSKADLIDDISDVAASLGRSPTLAEYTQLGNYSRAPLDRCFGSWNAAVEAAGLTPAKHYGIPTDLLCADLRRVAAEVDGTPSRRQYDSRGEYSVSTLADRFGSYNAAVDAVGLTRNEISGREPEYADLTPEDIGLAPALDS